MHLAIVRRASVIGLALVLLVAGSALADTLTADGDAILAGSQTTVDLGEVATSSAHGVDVEFVLACKNGSHLTAGATIAVDAADGGISVPDDGSLVVTPGAVTVPSTWPETGTYCDGTEPAAVVTPAHLALTAPSTAGPGRTFDVLFALANDEVVTNTIAITVVMDVVAPPPVDTTDPQLHGVPSDITVTTGGTSAAVSWTDPTATDDTDPSPAVACDPASGSTFPVGTTTVTCTATDAAGNDAQATFSVTVRHQAAPSRLVGAWQRPLAATVPALVGHAGRTVPLKLVVTADGANRGPSDIAAPTLRVERLAACAADAQGTPAPGGGTFAWADGVWQLNLDTPGFGVGCVRVVAAVGTTPVADAVIQLEGGDASTTARGRK